nr:class C sortase [Ruminococcus sp. 1001270H_150608_F2]
MKKVINIILVVIVACGLGILLYPVISNAINNYYNSSNIKQYDNEVKTLSDNDVDRILAKAEEYNKAVATYSYDNGIANYGDTYKEIINSYDDILNFGNSLIGYIEIPSINVYLPIYHGDLDNVLDKGSAHMKGTSFPIGGTGTHAVISAHSGYPRQKFFDDIDKLKKGDTFSITVLNKKLEYKVTEINIVKPTDTSHTRVQQGKDLVTLVTCYPYSVNSHRLLVTGERQANNKVAKQPQKVAYNQKIDKLEISIIPIILTLSYIYIFILKWRKKKGNPY